MVNIRTKTEYKNALELLVAAARKMAIAEEKLLKSPKPKKSPPKKIKQDEYTETEGYNEN